MNLREFYGPNAGYVLELYDRYQRDPDSVNAQTQDFFENWSSDGSSLSVQNAASVVGTVKLAQAVREYGHLAAQLDPLGSKPPGDPSLEAAFHDITENDLSQLPADLIGGEIGQSSPNAKAAIGALRSIYCSTIGFDFDHLHDPTERVWLRQAVESKRFQPTPETFDALGLLHRLTQVEMFEQFLHRLFPGKYRFSIEGLDMLIPMLDETICEAVGIGFDHIFIGTAHRGRLNIMAHVLDKPYTQILAEFKDPLRPNRFEAESGWTGDVKYHKGAQHRIVESDGANPMLVMPPNPSHLEAIAPILQGMARATGTYVQEAGSPTFNPVAALSILIHGDAGFSGQGIVAETLNLSRLEGYWTGGTIHIIVNNQLGFTTLPDEGRSTLYASDLAKGFKIPIVHVNADDPEACIEVARLAMAYRAEFGKDFLIDLIGYRRYGHNEGDEPAFTQPVMYRIIREHPTIRELWADHLVQQGVLDEGKPGEMIQQSMENLQAEYESLNAREDIVEPIVENPPEGAARRTNTQVPLKRLLTLSQSLLDLPDDFTLHATLTKNIERRRQELESPDAAAVDWAAAEDLALATIIEDGIGVRLTGQDVERGTFSQRHAVFHDAETGQTFTPLQSFPQANAAFEVHNSPLSEAAVLGFEYGYNVQQPGCLVIWEAQYGDFINNAQTIADEFIVSARAKWGQGSSLVMLLPHAWEGAGPDHSSGRLERFLQLAAELNVRIVNPTTAAQYFHLIRRQALLLEDDPLPLVVMTPKSLLRHPFIRSPLTDLAASRWQPVLDDEQASQQPEDVTHLVLASGKFVIDLLTSDYRNEHPEIAIVRVEQLYPFPAQALKMVFNTYSNIRAVIWAQEEPENMGAWTFMHLHLEPLTIGRWALRHISRGRNASPAEGSSTQHKTNQERLIKAVFNEHDER